MATVEQIEHLKTLFKENKERELKRLKVMEDPAVRHHHILSFIGMNTMFFLEKAFVEGDTQAAKNYLYKAAMANAYYHEKTGGEIFNVLNMFTYPLLSDSQEVIDRYMKYYKTEYTDSFATHFGKTIQCVLKDDHQALPFHIEGLKKQSASGWPEQYKLVIAVFEGLLSRDKPAIELGLQHLVALRDKQELPSVVKDFIHLEATALAKLAWRKGLEVHPNSEFIPQQLLPVKELASYERYSFFDEI